MTLKELTPEVAQLSQEELLQLLELVARLLRQALLAQTEGVGVLPYESTRGVTKQDAPESRGSSLERVLGMLRPDGPMVSDDEVDELLVQSLIEKHL